MNKTEKASPMCNQLNCRIWDIIPPSGGKKGSNTIHKTMTPAYTPKLEISGLIETGNCFTKN